MVRSTLNTTVQTYKGSIITIDDEPSEEGPLVFSHRGVLTTGGFGIIHSVVSLSVCIQSLKKSVLNRTHFALTNVQWQMACGRRTANARMQHLVTKMGLQPAIDALAQHSSRVSTSADCLPY